MENEVKIELKKNCKYAMLVPTSMGVRITPLDGQAVHNSDTFKMYATSAETNVASISSYLGLPVKVLTTFVKSSPIARFIKDNLAGRHMDYEGPEIEQAVARIHTLSHLGGKGAAGFAQLLGHKTLCFFVHGLFLVFFLDTANLRIS